MLVDVERGTGDHAGAKGVGQRALVHDRAAGGVDEVRRRAHPAQRRRIDEVVGVSVVRAVDGDDVARAQQLVERDPPSAARRLELGGDRSAAVVHDLHVERPGPAAQRLADGTHADDAQPSALQAGAEHDEHPPLPRLTGPDQALALREAPGDDEDEGHGQVGGGVGQDPGCVADEHTPLGAGGHVDVVEPDCDVGDQLQSRTGTQEAGIDDVGEERHRGIRGRQSLVPELVRDRLVAIPGPDLTGLAQRRQADIGDPAEDDDPRRLLRRHHPPPNRGSGAMGGTRPSRSRAAASFRRPVGVRRGVCRDSGR